MFWKSWVQVGLTSAALSLSVIPAHAAIVAYNFTVTPDSGPLAGNTYFGSFSFSDETLTGVGEEFLPESAITAINFNFVGENYTLADALSAGVQFQEGEFLGLEYVTDAVFAFAPGLTELESASFSYDLPSGAGFGDVSYTLVPEPSVLLGSIVLGVTGLAKRLKK
ncbi:PEP-CTERM sorting domain-containing protein [Gloeocapsa sp. PCC 73106]|uniref:PEP-CTERM sorting domain-containing protein n=1 Tax=Gloeocapsa sp. PCC 73106 TaxID=102232 RepID=UPI0002AC7511|nr:PEP-CTERM sorting domain-containing protein [Gloeocapsa sp. PCC 73106]ELR97355.1 PEP-CTERM putative exosortase interaction domain-containing protein [Gloeocapsa sp. PCC 73106]